MVRKTRANFTVCANHCDSQILEMVLDFKSTTTNCAKYCLYYDTCIIQHMSKVTRHLDAFSYMPSDHGDRLRAGEGEDFAIRKSSSPITALDTEWFSARTTNLIQATRQEQINQSL